MEVTMSLGMLVTLGMFLVSICALLGPGMYKLGQLRRDVDHNTKDITTLFKLITKVDDLVQELRERRRQGEE